MKLFLQKIRNILLLVLFFSLNFEVWDLLPGGGNLSLVKLVGLFYALSVFCGGKEFFKISRYTAKIFGPLFLFGLLLTIMNLIHMNWVSSTVIDSTYLQWSFFLVLMVNHFRMRPALLDRAMFSFVIGSVVLAFLALMGVGVAIEGGRMTIFGDNQNSLGIRMAISSAFLIYNMARNPLSQRMVVRVLLMLLTISMLYLQLKTGSRISLASFVGMFGLSTFLFRVKGFVGKLLYVLFVLAALWIFMDMASHNEILRNRVMVVFEKKDFGGRVDISQNVLPLFYENPIMGVGQSGYAMFSSSIYGKVFSPHNVITEILCYTGIIGLVLYSLFWWQLTKAALLRYRLKGDFFQLLLFIPLVGVVLTGQIFHVKLIWCIYAYMIAGGVISKRESIRFNGSPVFPSDSSNSFSNRSRVNNDYGALR